jgi:hypothetical protein
MVAYSYTRKRERPGSLYRAFLIFIKINLFQ